MSEERPETRSSTSVNLSLTHEATTTSQSEEQQLIVYMENAYNRILKNYPHAKLMLVSKNAKFLKTNYPQHRGLSNSACILNFADKVRVVMSKLMPDEPIENIRIRGRRDEIIVTYDEHLEIIVVDKDKTRMSK